MSWSAAFESLRVRQWVKNVFVLAPVVFAQGLNRTEILLDALLATAAFCAASSAAYIWNDIADRESDRLHPRKRLRPIASRRLAVGPASALAVALAAIGLGLAWAASPAVAGVCAGFLVLNVLYSALLRRLVVLDVMGLAASFLLRILAGSVAAGVALSAWLVLCTALIALFLGFVKRRQELVALGERVARHRAASREYSVPFIDQMISIVTASTVLAYSLYALSPETAAKYGTRWTGLTIPFVLYGIFRYLFLVHVRGEGGNPTDLVLADRGLQLTLLLWGATVLAVLYWP